MTFKVGTDHALFSAFLSLTLLSLIIKIQEHCKMASSQKRKRSPWQPQFHSIFSALFKTKFSKAKQTSNISLCNEFSALTFKQDHIQIDGVVALHMPIILFLFILLTRYHTFEGILFLPCFLHAFVKYQRTSSSFFEIKLI